MFDALKKNRSLIMGLAILWVAFYHIPWIDRNPILDFIHDTGYMGVDVFLLISGIGLCHSVKSRGRKGYLLQRAKRIFPGLMPVVLLWSLAMTVMGAMSCRELVGSVTLLGWWLGQTKQLNWYFSAVWMYFLLGVVLYTPVVKGKHPGLTVAGVSLLSFIILRVTPFWHHPTAFARIPIFLLGMLLGRAELQKTFPEKRLRGILYGLFPIGVLLTVMTWHSWGNLWGDSLGLWWYPFILVVPGGVFLFSELMARVTLPGWLRGAIEHLGEASSEALMLHVGIYKLIQQRWHLYPKQWMLVLLGCMLLAVLYHGLLKKLKK